MKHAICLKVDVKNPFPLSLHSFQLIKRNDRPGLRLCLPSQYCFILSQCYTTLITKIRIEFEFYVLKRCFLKMVRCNYRILNWVEPDLFCEIPSCFFAN